MRVVPQGDAGGPPPRMPIQPGLMPTGRQPQTGAGVPPTTRPPVANMERRSDGPSPPAVAPTDLPPGLAELKRPSMSTSGSSVAPIAAALTDALPSLDPELEQRIRSIFRDTAVGGGEPGKDKS